MLKWIILITLGVVGYIFIGCLTWRIGEAVEHIEYDDDTIFFAISLWWFVWIFVLGVLLFVEFPKWIVKVVQIVFVTIKYTIIAITTKDIDK